MTILVTGGAGFIGSNFVLEWLGVEQETLINLDALTYAGNPRNFVALAGDVRHELVHGDIGDRDLTGRLLREHQPRAVVHFAAESHVDRSIEGPGAFIKTNVTGTYCLLESVRSYLDAMDTRKREQFRFINVSTDEVFGSLAADAPPFTESSAFAPNSPYSASKAAADHIARAYFQTYGVPVISTHCSNNYGPLQFPEKLIPLIILQGIQGEVLPVYGDGKQVRDWLHVHDHCAALRAVLEKGEPGNSYNIGASCEKRNIDVVNAICEVLDEMRPVSGSKYGDQIEFVTDRPGHDRRYAIDSDKLQNATGWQPVRSFDESLRDTVSWYLDNERWIQEVSTGEYRKWIDTNYTQRVAR